MRGRAKPGREPIGKQFLECEQIRILENPSQGIRLRHVLVDGHDRDLAAAQTADEQGLALVNAVHAVPLIGIAEVEPALHFLAGKVAVPVKFDIVVDGRAVIGKEFYVIANDGLAPGLGGIGDVLAQRDQACGIGALHSAVRLIRVAVLRAEVYPSSIIAQADIARDAVGKSIAGLKDAGFELKRRAFVVVLELEVHHPGNGVRAVLRGRAVAQDFHALQCKGRNRGYVWPLRRVGYARGPPRDHGAAVAAFAIDEH